MHKRRLLPVLLFLAILFTFSAAGAAESELATPVADVPAALQAGEELVITLEAVNNATSYEIIVSGENIDNHYCTVYNPGQHTISPFGLNAGEYTVSIQAFNTSSGSTSEPAVYTLSVSGNRPSVPQWVAPQNVTTDDSKIWFTVYGNGVEGAKTFTFNRPSDYYVSNGFSVQVPISRWDIDYTSVYAKINGRWTNSFKVSVQVTDPSEDDYDLDVTLPKSIRLGDDLLLIVERWDEADYYTYSLSYQSKNDEPIEVVYENIFIPYEEVFMPDEYGRCVIPGQYFTTPGIWSIGVNAYQTSTWHGKYGGGEVAVLSVENSPAAPSITQVTQNPQMYEPVDFLINAAGASKISLLVRMDGGGGSYNVIIDTNDVNPCPFTFNIRDYGLSDYTAYQLVASAYYDDIGWSDYSEPLSFELMWDERLECDSDTNRITILPENPVVGDLLTISWGPVDGAQWYGVVINGEYIQVPAGALSVTYDTSALNSGSNYCYVNAYAVGKLSDYLYKYFEARSLAYKPIVTTESKSVLVGENAVLTVNTTSGDTLNVYVNDQLYGIVKRREETGSQEICLSFPGRGIYAVTVEAVDDHIRSVMSDPVTILVRDPDMPEEVFVLPKSLTRIEDEAFAGIQNVTVQLSGTVEYVSPTAFDRSVTIIAPAGSPAAVQCGNYGLTVVTQH